MAKYQTTKVRTDCDLCEETISSVEDHPAGWVVVPVNMSEFDLCPSCVETTLQRAVIDALGRDLQPRVFDTRHEQVDLPLGY